MRLDKGRYEIRLESIGGLGANLAGKLLGELGAYKLELNSQSFASYGSEKRGSPVKGFIRYADIDKEIRINSPIAEPDLLALFNMGVADKENVMAGVKENTAVVVNTDGEADEIRDRLKMYSGKLYRIDALKWALKYKTRVNMVMLGAIAKASGFIPVEDMVAVVSETLGKKYPKSIPGNADGIKAGYENVVVTEYKDDGKYPYVEYKEIEREWGYKNAPIGGVNPVWGSIITNNLEGSREGYIPLFNKEKCINCGLCDTTCPDMVYQFVMGEYKGRPSMVNLGPDYYHCKGCLRCVEVCPTSAITEGFENEHDVMAMNVGNVRLLDKNFHFDKVGPNSWMESESYTGNSDK